MNRSVSADERALRVYRAKVRRLVTQSFGLSDAEMRAGDVIWDHWQDCVREGRAGNPLLAHNRSGEAAMLRDLLRHRGLKDVFKARAIAVLSAPTLAWTPFPYPTRNQEWSYAPEWFASWGTGFHLRGDVSESEVPFTEVIGEFSLPLQQFFWTLLEINLEAAGWLVEKKRNPTPFESERNVAYNRLILRALRTVSVESSQAERLFQYYQTDPTGQWLGFWLSGANYAPFQEILRSGLDQWRMLADAQWRSIIVDRRASTVESIRQTWTSILLRYGNEVEKSLDGNEVRVSTDLVASQVEWIMDAVQGTAFRPFHYDAWHPFLAALRSERYRDIRHRFVRHMALTDDPERPFRVTSESVNSVKRALREFGSTDSELAEKLSWALAQYDAVAEQQTRRRSKMEMAVQAMT